MFLSFTTALLIFFFIISYCLHYFKLGATYTPKVLTASLYFNYFILTLFIVISIRIFFICFWPRLIFYFHVKHIVFWCSINPPVAEYSRLNISKINCVLYWYISLIVKKSVSSMKPMHNSWVSSFDIRALIIHQSLRCSSFFIIKHEVSLHPSPNILIP